MSMEIISLVLGCSVSTALVQHIFGRILDYFLRKRKRLPTGRKGSLKRSIRSWCGMCAIS